MKQKIKKIKSLLTISLAGLLLYGCERDQVEIQNSQTTVSHKQFKELIKQENFNHPVSQIQKKNEEFSRKSAMGKTAMEEEYGFTISDQLVNVVQNDTLTSYTMLITRDSIAPNEVENLILQTTSNQTQAYIIKYDSNNLGTSITPIDYNDTTSTNRYSLVCATVSVWVCTYEGHTTDGVCTHGHWSSSVYCTSIGGDGGQEQTNTSGGTYTPNNHNGGSGSGTNSSIITSPVKPCTQDCPDVAPDPCIKIQKLLASSPVMSQELANLATQTSDVVEHGKYKLTTLPGITPVAAGTNGTVSFPTPNTGIAFSLIAHTHNSPANNTYSIFSYSDFEFILTFMKQGKISPDCVITLSTADGTNYAMLIDDQTRFLQFFAQINDSNFDFQSYNDHDKVINNYYGLRKKSPIPIIKENSTIGNLGDEKAFLDMINDFNMGVSLLEANSTFTTFTKVTHNKTTDNIDHQQPCN